MFLMLASFWQEPLTRRVQLSPSPIAQACAEGRYGGENFGWAKFIGPIRQVMVRGMAEMDQVFMQASWLDCHRSITAKATSAQDEQFFSSL